MQTHSSSSCYHGFPVTFSLQANPKWPQNIPNGVSHGVHIGVNVCSKVALSSRKSQGFIEVVFCRKLVVFFWLNLFQMIAMIQLYNVNVLVSKLVTSSYGVWGFKCQTLISVDFHDVCKAIHPLMYGLGIFAMPYVYVS